VQVNGVVTQYISVEAGSRASIVLRKPGQYTIKSQ